MMTKFSDFMEEWLYGKDGYYTDFKTIGKKGDFYTAVSTSIFFGGAISNRLISTIDSGFLPNDTMVVEIGAHQGYLLADMIQFIYTLRPELLKTLRFAIVEPREKLRQAQQEYFSASFGDQILLTHYNSLAQIDEQHAFIVANEIFDAFSCEVIKDQKMLVIDRDFSIDFKELDASTQAIVDRYDLHNGEVGVGYELFAKQMQKAFKHFEFVTFDYGDMGHREDFSLRIYDQNRVYPFFELTDFVTEKDHQKTIEEFYKSSDITYDVDFQHLKDAYEDIGCTLSLYKTQAAALIEFGITNLLEMLEKKSDFATYKQHLEKVKVLIEPAFMGERFKCAIFRSQK
jgi:SAM-dependent MidA family methyltransferase